MKGLGFNRVYLEADKVVNMATCPDTRRFQVLRNSGTDV